MIHIFTLLKHDTHTLTYVYRSLYKCNESKHPISSLLFTKTWSLYLELECIPGFVTSDIARSVWADNIPCICKCVRDQHAGTAHRQLRSSVADHPFLEFAAISSVLQYRAASIDSRATVS